MAARASWRGAKWLAGKGMGLAKSANNARSQAGRSRAPPEFEALKEIEVATGSLADFEDFLYSSKSSVGLVIGSRGSGKSVLGMRLLENAAARGRSVSSIGFDAAVLPSWIRAVKASQLNDVKNGSFLLVDEGGVSFSSRDSMSGANKLLSDLLLVSRHKDLSVLFVSQNSANIEVNALRQADYLLFKKPSLLQRDFERKRINEIYDAAAAGFKNHSSEGKKLFYCYSDAFVGFAGNAAPSFWSERASKSFASERLGKQEK